MFKPIEGGSELTIGEDDLALTVYLPPVGFVWNWETKKLERGEIICRSSIPEDQYWEKPKKPDQYEKKAIREAEIQESNPEYVDPELQEYRAREWYRRKFGVWFMNNGDYIYLTGPYYFYLAHWTLDVGPPKFKIADLQKAYFWEYCVEDPQCYGMLEMTKRRVGKSYFAACMHYEYTSRTSNAHFGIQSKTRTDAGLVFSEKLIQPWRKLVDFFRPTFDTSQGDIPKSSLRFFRTANKGSKIEGRYDRGGELESWIDFGASDAICYDGQKMLRYMCDEVFKTTECDIIDRHKVVRPCLEDESGNIIGKAIYTSTVEDMEGHLELYEKLWKESDFTKKNKNGRTISGLYRFFTPAQNIMYVDKYGYPDIEKALTQIENEIAELTDPRDIAGYIRKNPRNWKEAFRTGGDNCLYNPLKLDDRSAILNFMKDSDLYKRYNLVWDENPQENGIPKVRLVESPNGRFKFSYHFREDEMNDVLKRGTSFYPKNIARFVIGIDPFDHNRTKDGKFSNGAAAVYMKYDPLNPDVSENFVGIYVSRPPTAQIFYEDMIKLCHLFSCQMLFEDNKIGIMHYFNERGYGAFMMRDEKGNVGVSATTKSHQTLVEHTELFIEDHCHKVNFPELLKDWKEFDIDDTTKFDIAMASGWALVAASRIKRKVNALSKLTPPKKGQFIRKFKIKKSNGKFSKSLY
jgi:hypothetical protein